MTSQDKLAGQCLCGAVTLHLQQWDPHAGACHCGMCRQWGGGPFLSVAGGKTLVIEGEDRIKRYRSSDWAERAFCSECGTHLFYHGLPSGDHYIAAGLFPGARLELHHQIYIDKKPDWYAFAGTSQTLTEAEVIALYSQAD